MKQQISRSLDSKEMSLIILFMLALVMIFFAVQLSSKTAVNSARTRPQPTLLTETEQVEMAQMTLMKYFSELHDGNYAQAAKHFDGSYVVLQAMNTHDPAIDHTTLLEDACELNGFACLNVLEVNFVRRIDEDSYQFEVIFQYDNGVVFYAEAEDGTLNSRFPFTVVAQQNGFMVRQLPPLSS